MDSSLAVSEVELLTGFRIFLGELAREAHYEPVGVELAVCGFLTLGAYQLVLVD